jgi:hypothetical protein
VRRLDLWAMKRSPLCVCTWFWKMTVEGMCVCQLPTPEPRLPPCLVYIKPYLEYKFEPTPSACHPHTID